MLSQNKAIILFLLTISILRVFYIPTIPLAPDEAYYWVCSKFPSLSYFDHPPFTIWMIRAFTLLLGDTELAIRLPTVIGCLIIYIVTYLIAKNSLTTINPWILIFLILSTPIFAVGGIINTPDTYFLMFWALSTFSLFKILKENNYKYYLLLGTTLGFGLLSKYTTVLFLIAFFIYMILFRRDMLKNNYMKLTIALVLAFLLFLPVIIWNMQHDFASFKFQLLHGFGKTLYTRTQIIKNILIYVGGMAAVINPFLFVIVIVSSTSYIIKAIKYKNENYQPLLFMALSSVTVILFFGISAIRTKVEANWPLTVYYYGIILSSIFISEHKNKLIKALLVAIIAMNTTIDIFLHYPGILYKTLQMKIKKEPTDELYGWQELASYVENMRKELEKKCGKTPLVLANSYQTASELQFYLPGKPYVYSLNINRRKNMYTYLPKPKIHPGDIVIFVDEIDPNLIKKYFEKIEHEEFKFFRYGILKSEFVIYKAYNYRGGLL
jgi:4-amino-4-deoxy-L-arabinose transferase-like glycosyltransferase